MVTKKERSEEPGLSPEEIEAQSGETLPDREAMSLIDANIVIPIDATIAADVLSEESIADAEDAETEQET